MNTNTNVDIKVTELIDVKAPYDTVRGYASDPTLLAGWNNEFTGYELVPAGDDTEPVKFCCTTRGGGDATWKVTLTEGDASGITHVEADIEARRGRPDAARADLPEAEVGRTVRWRETAGVGR